MISGTAIQTEPSACIAVPGSAGCVLLLVAAHTDSFVVHFYPIHRKNDHILMLVCKTVKGTTITKRCIKRNLL